MEVYFLSDIHLKSLEERNGKILLRFLRSLLDRDPKATQLFLLGDIFDLWVSNGKAFVKKYKELTDLIQQLTNSGMKIVFFEGNHDLHIHPFWKDILNVEVYVDPQYFQIDGVTLRLEHGDLINLEDHNYLRLRRTLRNPLVEKIGHLMPGEFWLKVGELWSPISRSKSNQYRVRNETQIIEMIRRHAPRAYAEKQFDAIITGHMHVRDDFKMNIQGHDIHSFNLGSWFQDVQILKLDKGQFEWLKLENA